MKKPSETNWARVDAQSDATIDTSDTAPLSDSFFARAKLRIPRQPMTQVSVHLDPGVLAWFKAQGETWEQQLNAALRIYAEAHETYKGHESGG